MNFDRFTQQLKASAAIAAEVAANFQGFDEMAANDDYVQSPEFNVTTGGRRRANADRNLTQQQNFDDASTLSTHSSLRASSVLPTANLASLHQPQPGAFHTNTKYSNPNQATPLPSDGDGTGSSDRKRQLVPLKVSVPERQTQTLLRLQQQQEGEDDSLSRSSDDEDINDDPIISLLKQEKQEASRSSGPQSRATNISGDKATGAAKHRFFQDLEQRMSMPEQPATRFELENEVGSSIQQQGPPSGDSSTLPTANPLKSLLQRGIPLPWNQSDTTAKYNAPRVPFFSRSRASPANTDPLSNVAVVSGAAMLSADELKQLDQAVQQQQQSRPFRLSRRETFVACTLVLAAFVYFFLSRSPTWTRTL